MPLSLPASTVAKAFICILVMFQLLWTGFRYLPKMYDEQTLDEFKKYLIPFDYKKSCTGSICLNDISKTNKPGKEVATTENEIYQIKKLIKGGLQRIKPDENRTGLTSESGLKSPEIVTPPENSELISKSGSKASETLDAENEKVTPYSTPADVIETTQSGIPSSSSDLPLCPRTSTYLKGEKSISLQQVPPSYEQTEKDNPALFLGGYFKPQTCEPRWKVAVVIPFRNRDVHLHYFLYYMHPILQRQQLEYRIYVINQIDGGKFNRAKLLNVGFVEALKDLDFGCFVFHDVDLILENDNTVYSCPNNPRHLSHAQSNFRYRLPYMSFFGGVSQMTKQQIEKINGLPNNYWGWGGEDDDIYNRVRIKGMHMVRYPADIARYRAIPHERDKGNELNPKRFDLIRKTGLSMKTNGLNSLKYKVVSRQDHPLFTNITVDIFAPEKFR